MTTPNPRPYLGSYHGTLHCSKCDSLAIGYTNYPNGRNPQPYCAIHAPPVLANIRPNTLVTWNVVRYTNAIPTHYVVGRFPEGPVLWPEIHAWAHRYRGDPINRYSVDDPDSREFEQWEEDLYWEWKVLRYVLAKYGDDWEPTEDREGKYLCPVCLNRVDDQDYRYVSEYRGECWGMPAWEEMPDRMVCPRCGYEEDL